MQKFLVLIFLLIASPAFTQAIFEWDQGKSVRENGQVIPIGFSQGINSAQIQTIDLTGDGVEEWVVWDINSRQLQVFEKKGENFSLRPELSYFFPAEISGFLVLADFDRDGKITQRIADAVSLHLLFVGGSQPGIFNHGAAR